MPRNPRIDPLFHSSPLLFDEPSSIDMNVIDSVAQTSNPSKTNLIASFLITQIAIHLNHDSFLHLQQHEILRRSLTPHSR